MRTADFEAQLTPDGQIALPAEIASQLRRGERVLVSLRWDSTDDGWDGTGRKSFAAARDSDEAVYDLLADDSVA
jgi:hypothetical protein